MNSNCINLKEKGGNEAANQRVCRPAGVRAPPHRGVFEPALYILQRQPQVSPSLSFRVRPGFPSGVPPSVGRALGGRSKWSNGAGTPLQSIESARGRGRERERATKPTSEKGRSSLLLRRVGRKRRILRRANGRPERHPLRYEEEILRSLLH